VLHDTQLTPSFNVSPLGPFTIARVFMLAINRSPLVVTTAKSSAVASAGFGIKALTDAPFVPISKAESVLLFNSCCTSYTARPPPASAEMARQLPSTENATCDILVPIGRTSCGVKGWTLLPLSVMFLKASLIASAFAMTTELGPAAATRPGFDATLSKDEVGGGKASAGHASGRSFSFVSPLKRWNSIVCDS